MRRQAITVFNFSQFENHVRTILGLPLGSSRMIAPAAVMINMLGNKEGNGSPTGIEKALAIEGAYVHVYGKTTTNIGRKMGHINIVDKKVCFKRLLKLQSI